MTTTQNSCASASTPETESRRTFIPRYAARETEHAFIVTAYVPGVDRTRLETTLEDNRLTVVAKRSGTPPESWTPLHREIPQVDYRLDLQLDRRVNQEAVKAELVQGVLTLTLPKAEAAKPRRIEIAG